MPRPHSGPLLVSGLLLLSLAGAARAATPAAELLESARRAMLLAPGAPAPAVDARARCTGPGGEFLTRVVSDPGGGMRFEQSLSSGQFAILGIADGRAWSYDWLAQDTTWAEAAYIPFLRGHEFHMLALAPGSRLRGPAGAAMEMTWAGRPALALRFTGPDSLPVVLFYDRDSALPLGLTLVDAEAPAGPPIQVRFSDWRPVGGLNLFHRLELDHGAERFAYDFQAVSVGPVDPERLAPSGEFGADPDVAALLDLQRQARQAHLAYDADLLVSTMADPSTGLRRGEVTRNSRAGNRARFKAYFKNVEFQEWADLEAPRVRVSRDGTMAYVIVQKRVRLTTRSQPPQSEETIFAWMEAWEKRDGAWLLQAIASTDGSGEVAR